MSLNLPRMRPGLMRRSTSVCSDGTGDVPMEKLAEGNGKTKRVRGLAYILVSHSFRTVF